MAFMNCPRILEILEDENNRISSTKFCVLLGQFSACAVIAITTWRGELQEGLFTLFLLYSGGLYGLGRVTQSNEIKTRINAENPAPLAPIVPPVVPISVPAATSPSDTINMPGSPGSDVPARDVTVKAEGDVSVSK